MDVINRSVAVIKPKAAYVEWANSLSEPEEQTTVENLRIDCDVFLLSENDDAQDPLIDKYSEIFKVELSSWIADEIHWPKNRTYEMFLEWFDVEIHSIVFDITNDEIKKEGYEF